GRFPRRYHGRVIAIEPAQKMLAVAQSQLASFPATERAQLLLVQQYAEQLPLPTAVADAVTCLEALEFFANPDQAIRELVRVLRPGGVLFLTRRHGLEAHLFLHRYRSQAKLHHDLTTLGMTDINEISWEIDYNLLIARKAHTR
ncbi:MAG: class I SAM-dependent methyltransferase, partial [Anaerolineales bacterium]|nr:class I SAM-dependent methyltransferase [Anaerolineales bacterium]